MTRRRRPASVSVDLDDRWTYLQMRGEGTAGGGASILPLAIERALELLAAHGTRATFFVVGRDARRAELGDALAAIRAGGHEIGNHSEDHLPWLPRLEPARQLEQVERAEEAIAAATGVRPRGFRGPGHGVSDAVRALLVERGYLYDASPLPTFVTPLGAWLYLRGLPLDDAQRRERAQLAGGFAAGFGSNRARLLGSGAGALIEIPVTTLPLLRLPIHLTYLHLLAIRSRGAALAYAALARSALRIAGSEPSLLLHATDFLGREDGAGLDFFPAMTVPAATKLSLLDRVLAPIAERYELGTLEQHALAVAARRRASGGAGVRT